MSLPSRERGLKLDDAGHCSHLRSVAPFTGAWIEIVGHECEGLGLPVAPFTGAWIEISRPQTRNPGRRVAPFTGAWIEISKSCSLVNRPLCRSFHGSVD